MVNTDQLSTINYTVTVQNVNGGNKYFIDGQQQQTLTLFEGNTYIFDWSSITSHPFKFSTIPDDIVGEGEYTTGVTIDRTTYKTTIVVDSSTPNLYYHCEVHSGMGGQANTMDASDINTFIKVVDEGLTLNLNPRLEYLTTNEITQLVPDSSFVLNPGSYNLTILQGAFTDFTNNTTPADITFTFNVNYVTPYFDLSLSDISNDVLSHVFDLSRTLLYPPFTLDDLTIVLTTTSIYVNSVTYDGNSQVTLDLSSNIQNISILETTVIEIPIVFSLGYSTYTVSYEEIVYATNVYKHSVLTAPANTTLRKQKGEIFSYSLKHTDTRFEDLSYNIENTSTYYGTLDVSFVNVTTYTSALNIELNLTPIDNTLLDISINIIDEAQSVTVSQIETITFNAAYRLPRVTEPLIVTFDQVFV